MKLNKEDVVIKNSNIDETSFIDKGIRIHNSTVDKDVSCYKFSHIVSSKIGKNSIIGDLSKVDGCNLGIYNKIEKYNHLYNSKIGDYSYTGPYTVMMHCEIGKYNAISWGVSLGGAEHDYERVTNHAFLYNPYFEISMKDQVAYDRFEKPCYIGNDVWIGCNATILRGVSIGDGAVIAANAVVHKDVPPYSIVGGVPAKVLKYRFSEEIIKNLLDIKWWDLPPSVIKTNRNIFKQKITLDTIRDLKLIKQNL